jgi:hypothetical protein
MADYDDDRHKKEELERRERRKVSCRLLNTILRWTRLRLRRSFGCLLYLYMFRTLTRRRFNHLCSPPKLKNQMPNEKRNESERSTQPRFSASRRALVTARNERQKARETIRQSSRSSLRSGRRDFKLTFDFGMLLLVHP